MLTASPFLQLLAFHAAFALYLAQARVGVALAAKTLGASLGASLLGATLAFSGLAWIGSARDPVAAYPYVVLGCAFVAAPIVAWSLAREAIVGRMPVLEVVLVNAVALTIPNSLLHYWMDPVSWIMGSAIPPGQGRFLLHAAIALWPTWLALAMMARGGEGGARGRFILALWLVVTGTLWMAPAVKEAAAVFDFRDAAAIAKTLVASLAVIHVSIHAVGVLLLAARGDAWKEGGALDADLAFFAGRVYLGRMRWPLALALGIATYAALRLLAAKLGWRAWGEASTLHLLALGFAITAARMLMPPDEAEEPAADSVPGAEAIALRDLWEKRGWFFPIAAAVLVFPLYGWVIAETGPVLPGDGYFAFVQVAGFVAATILLWIALACVFRLAEVATGRDFSARRRTAMFLGLAAIAAYQVATLPRGVPDELVVSERPVAAGRVLYVSEPHGDAMEKALYLESHSFGRTQRAICRRWRDEPLLSFRVLGDGRVACYYRSRFVVVQVPDVVIEPREYSALEKRGPDGAPLPLEMQ